jgi:DNA-binding Lrp family transcriptional regulator
MRSAVERYPEVVAASTVTGDVDVVVQVRARDMRHLEQVVERLAAEPFVARTRSTIVLSALVRRPDVPPPA